MAAPIQKSEKTIAEPRAKTTVERANDAKTRRGRNEKASWMARNDCAESATRLA